VHKNIRFWNSINFTPDDPKQSQKDANVFYVKKAYDLPKQITLNLAHPFVSLSEKPILPADKKEEKKLGKITIPPWEVLPDPRDIKDKLEEPELLQEGVSLLEFKSNKELPKS